MCLRKERWNLIATTLSRATLWDWGPRVLWQKPVLLPGVTFSKTSWVLEGYRSTNCACAAHSHLKACGISASAQPLEQSQFPHLASILCWGTTSLWFWVWGGKVAVRTEVCLIGGKKTTCLERTRLGQWASCTSITQVKKQKTLHVYKLLLLEVMKYTTVKAVLISPKLFTF